MQSGKPDCTFKPVCAKKQPLNDHLIIVQNRSKGLWSTDQGCVDIGPEGTMVVRPGDSCFEYLGFSRNFLGATMLHVEPFFPPFSLVQNRTDDFSASFSPLRCSALQPSPQCTASALSVHCIRPCSALHPSLQVRASVLASTCVST